MSLELSVDLATLALYDTVIYAGHSPCRPLPQIPVAGAQLIQAGGSVCVCTCACMRACACVFACVSGRVGMALFMSECYCHLEDIYTRDLDHLHYERCKSSKSRKTKRGKGSTISLLFMKGSTTSLLFMEAHILMEKEKTRGISKA